MTRFLPIAALSILAATAACQRREDAPKPAPAPAPAVAAAAPAVEHLDQKTLETMAFRAAWGAPPPVTHASSTKDTGNVSITYAAGKLTPLGGDRYAFISDGKGGESHVEGGALAIHYLKRTATGFERIGAWPEFLLDGTFGAPPEWTVRTDLTAAPAILTDSGGTWQGYTCTWSNVIELAPDGPVIRADTIPVGYDSSGAAVDAKDAEEMEATIAPGEKGRSFVVRYTGDRKADVTYALSGAKYVATTKPDLLTC